MTMGGWWSIAIWALLLVLPLVDPLRRNYARFPGTLKLVRWLVPLLNVGIHLVVTLGALGAPVDHGKGVRTVVAIVFLVLGNSFVTHVSGPFPRRQARAAPGNRFVQSTPFASTTAPRRPAATTAAARVLKSRRWR